jgi:hypothetical protein
LFFDVDFINTQKIYDVPKQWPEEPCFMLIFLLTDKTAARKEWNLDLYR